MKVVNEREVPAIHVAVNNATQHKTRGIRTDVVSDNSLIPQHSASEDTMPGLDRQEILIL